MNRNRLDAQTGSLCASVAAHPVGQLPSVTADQFQTLCRDMQGAFPDLVKSSMAGVVAAGRATSLSERAEFDFEGPEPSPVDFDWRFDGRTTRRLAAALIGGNNREVLCVGTPTVYAAIRALGGHAFLIDRNPLLARSLSDGRFLIADLSTEENLASRVNHKFDIAVVDPPWYGEAYELWLARTLPLLRPGAEILVVMFRRFTRASAQEERTQLLKGFERLGRVSFEPFEAVYSTPPFEQEVLSRLQLPWMPSWRAGDILKIELHPDPDSSLLRPLAWPVSKWERFDLGDQVIAVKQVAGDDGPLQVANEFPSEIMTVSQRDPMRALYTVWTSRSKAAVVKGTKRLLTILNKSTEITVERSDLQVATQLSQQLGFQIGGSRAR